MSNDTIFIHGLTIHAHHGVMEHESKVGQRFEIDIEIGIDLARAVQSDRLADTLSYARIAEIATKAFTASSFRLIEAAAGHVADAILAECAPADNVRIKVHKPHAPIAAIFADVGVILTRTRGGR